MYLSSVGAIEAKMALDLPAEQVVRLMIDQLQQMGYRYVMKRGIYPCGQDGRRKSEEEASRSEEELQQERRSVKGRALQSLARSCGGRLLRHTLLGARICPAHVIPKEPD